MRPRVLIVDDDSVLADLYCARFKEEDFDARTVYSARDAIETLDHFAPDVMILDICMPDLSGLDLYDLIEPKVQEDDIKIVFLTALNLNRHEQREIAKKGQRCLFKIEVLPKDLVKLVKKLAEERIAKSHI